MPYCIVCLHRKWISWAWQTQRQHFIVCASAHRIGGVLTSRYSSHFPALTMVFTLLHLSLFSFALAKFFPTQLSYHLPIFLTTIRSLCTPTITLLPRLSCIRAPLLFTYLSLLWAVNIWRAELLSYSFLGV